MTKFEFIAVLLSIIFGLGLTNLLSGLLKAFIRRELTDTRLAWSILVANLLLLNWWLLFRWSGHPVWQFHEFLHLVIYATAHYLMAVCLYPYENLSEYSEELQRKYLLWSLLAVAVLDVGENIFRGDLFDPWYYLLMILYFVILTILPLVNPKPSIMRACGWVLAGSMLAWSVVVRSVLASQ